MAPEQLEGQEADARTDLFAFGVVLYEMLAGRRAFEGKTHASLLSAILKDQPPPVSTVRPLVPASLDHVVAKCMEKDPEARWHSAHDLHDELAWIASNRPASGAVATAAARPGRQWAGWIAALAVAVIGAALWIFGSGWRGTPVASDAPEMRLQILTPADASIGGFALSPDRRAIVYQATTDGRPRLWLRMLDSDAARPLDGTDRSLGWAAPFWSPDSRSIAFFAAEQLKRLDLESGLVRTLASAPQPRGGTWGSTGKIMFASGSAGSLNAVPAGGGEVQAVTRVDRPRQTGHRFPHFLPDGRHFLFYPIGTAEGRGVYLGDLGSTATERLFDADSAAVFSAPDFVLFARQGVLWAQRMEMTALRPVGDPAAVSAKVAVSGRAVWRRRAVGDRPRADRLSGSRRDAAVPLVRSDRPAGRHHGAFQTTVSRPRPSCRATGGR